MNHAKAGPKVPAAANVLRILRYVGSQAGPVHAAAIARDLDLPRSTTYDLLQTLLDDGFIVHLPEEFKYALGVTAHELGTGYSRQVPLQRMSRFPLANLVSKTRKTGHLAVMHGRDVIYVIEERAPRQRPLVTDTGVRLPAHLTASGRAMLAWMDTPQVAALYAGQGIFPARNSDAPQSLPELLDLLKQVRAAGFSWEQDEVTVGYSSVAVPVLDRHHYPVASVTLTVANGTLPFDAVLARASNSEEGKRSVNLEDMASKWVPDVARCAREISRRIRPKRSAPDGWAQTTARG